MDLIITYSANLSFTASSAASSVFSEEVRAAAITGSNLRLTRLRYDTGYSATGGTIITLTFNPASTGTGTVSIDPGSSTVLAYDDAANLLQSISGATFTILAGGSPPPPPPASSSSTSTAAVNRGGGGGGGRRTETLSSYLRTIDSLSGSASSSAARSSAASTFSGETQSFQDVPVNAWYQLGLSELLTLGVVRGYTDANGHPLNRFGPGDPVTHAEILAMSFRSVGREASAETPANISARGTWAAGWLRTAEDAGFTLYQPELNVHQPAPRGAVVQTLLEAFGIHFELQPHSFNDLPEHHPHAAALSTAAQLGIVTGDLAADGTPLNSVRPDDPMNRAETVILIFRILTNGRTLSGRLPGASLAPVVDLIKPTALRLLSAL